MHNGFQISADWYLLLPVVMQGSVLSTGVLNDAGSRGVGVFWSASAISLMPWLILSPISKSSRLDSQAHAQHAAPQNRGVKKLNKPDKVIKGIKVKDISTREAMQAECAKADEQWAEYHEEESSPMTDLFVGQIQSTLICQQCNHRFSTCVRRLCCFLTVVETALPAGLF